MIGGDCIKGKPVCKMWQGEESGLAGWTGSNKSLLQHEASIASAKIKSVFDHVTQVKQRAF